MTVKFYDAGSSTSALRICVYWEWSNAPLLSGDPITDTIAIRWEGTDNSGHPLNLSFNSGDSSSIVNYYTRSGDYRFFREVPIECKSPYTHAYSEIPLGSGVYEEGYVIYAKSGSFYVQVDRTGTDVINEAAFCFAYGHSVIGLAPSVSIPPSFSISFSAGSQKMIEEAVRLDNRGNIVEY